MEQEVMSPPVESPSPQPEKKPVHFRDWLNVLYHTHSKFSTLAYEEERPELQSLLQNWQDGQFSTKVLAETAFRMGEKRGGFFVVDTEHAAHSMREYHPSLFPDKSPDEVKTMRKRAFLPEHIAATVAHLSQNLDVRTQATAKLNETHPQLKDRIFSGVEVDILNADGILDITNKSLARCDVVGASLHKDEWADTNGGKPPTLSDLISAYKKIADNPDVDVINHFIREIPAQVFEDIRSNPECFDKLFSQLAKTGTCLEINLRDIIDPKRKDQNDLMIMFARRAKERGVKFMLGLDFHRIEQYLPEVLPNGKAQEAVPVSSREKLQKIADGDIFFTSPVEAEQFEKDLTSTLQDVFEARENTPLPRHLTQLARPVYKAIRELMAVGITPDDIMNGDDTRFRQWVSKTHPRGV